MNASVKVALATLLCSFALIACGDENEASVNYDECVTNDTCFNKYNKNYVCTTSRTCKLRSEASLDELYNKADKCIPDEEWFSEIENKCLPNCPAGSYRNENTGNCIEHECWIDPKDAKNNKNCKQSWEKCNKDHKCIDNRICNDVNRNCADGFICNKSRWDCEDVRECHSGKKCDQPLHCSDDYRCVPDCVTKNDCPSQWDQCLEGECVDGRDCNNTGKNCENGYKCDYATGKCEDNRECTFEPNDPRKCTDGLECDPDKFTCTIDNRECVPALGRNCGTDQYCDDNYKCVMAQCNNTDKECAEGQKCVVGQCAVIYPHTECTNSCADNKYQCIDGQCILKAASPFIMTVYVSQPDIVHFDAFYGRYGVPTNGVYYANNETFIDCGGGRPIYTYKNDQNYQGHACQYTKSGTYTIKLYGQVDHLALCLSQKVSLDEHYYKIESVDQWGDSRWKSLESMFSDCSGLTIKDASAPDIRNVQRATNMFQGTNGVTVTATLFDRAEKSLDFSGLFLGASNISNVISQWKTNRVTDMNIMFRYSDFNGNLSNWDVSRVTNMSRMFLGAQFFTGCNAFNGWDLGSLVTANEMFKESGLRCLPSWCLPQLADYESMFGGIPQCVELRGHISCLPSGVSIGSLGCWN